MSPFSLGSVQPAASRYAAVAAAVGLTLTVSGCGSGAPPESGAGASVASGKSVAPTSRPTISTYVPSSRYWTYCGTWA